MLKHFKSFYKMTTNKTRYGLLFDYELKKIPGKGLGLVTKVPLKKGFIWYNPSEESSISFNNKEEFYKFIKGKSNDEIK